MGRVAHHPDTLVVRSDADIRGSERECLCNFSHYELIKHTK